MDKVSGAVLLYDGECGLCGAVVRGLLRLDRRGRLRFADLQGGFARATLLRLGLPLTDFDSLVFLPEAEGGVFQLRSDGVIAVLYLLGGGARALGAVMRIMPAAWRDGGYRGVARARHRVLGRRAITPLWDSRRAERFIE